MKAKVINPESKYYGRTVNVRKMEDSRFFANRYEMVYGNRVSFGDELDFNIAPVNNPVSVDWSAFRREAAKDILSSLIEKASEVYELESLVKEEWCKQAVEWADELIKQLKVCN